MKLLRGISTLGCAELDLPGALALATHHGLDAVELRALGGGLDLPTILTAQHGTPGAANAVTHGRRATVVALDTSFKLIGNTAGDREQLLSHVPWAEAFGARHLRIFDGGLNAGRAEMEEAAATIAWWRRLRAKAGWRVDLMVETHDALTTTAAIRQFAQAAPGCGLLWDTHHTWKKGGEDPLATWEAIAPQVVHIHVKDSVSRPSPRHPFTYVLPGNGEFPFAPLLERLRAEFKGVVSLEWERMWHPYLPPLEEALRVAAARHWW